MVCNVLARRDQRLGGNMARAGKAVGCCYRPEIPFCIFSCPRHPRAPLLLLNTRLKHYVCPVHRADEYLASELALAVRGALQSSAVDYPDYDHRPIGWLSSSEDICRTSRCSAFDADLIFSCLWTFPPDRVRRQIDERLEPDDRCLQGGQAKGALNRGRP